MCPSHSRCLPSALSMENVCRVRLSINTTIIYLESAWHVWAVSGLFFRPLLLHQARVTHTKWKSTAKRIFLFLCHTGGRETSSCRKYKLSKYIYPANTEPFLSSHRNSSKNQATTIQKTHSNKRMEYARTTDPPTAISTIQVLLNYSGNSTSYLL